MKGRGGEGRFVLVCRIVRFKKIQKENCSFFFLVEIEG